MALVNYSSIRRDGGTQPRAIIDYDLISEYKELYSAGVSLPPPVVFYDGTDYWLADGFHRHSAFSVLGKSEMECDVRQGTREDAVWFSCAANIGHGLRRTNADKRRAVMSALQHPKSQKLSDRAIAEHCGVGYSLVSEIRKQQVPESGTSNEPRIGLDGKQYKPHSEKRKAAKETQKTTKPIKETPTESDAPCLRHLPEPADRDNDQSDADYDYVAHAAIRLCDMANQLPVAQRQSILRIINGRIETSEAA